ncbi:DUF1778 domain-containing protein [Shewanella colwelliana]|uniref:type II toxin -antitoxin system TacA 1-like antitoxin n=1 Tax=Shewanella colwelliana TaxID=23 RepID=UPI00384AC0A9
MTQHLDILTTVEIKDMLEAAGALNGLTLNSFILETACVWERHDFVSSNSRICSYKALFSVSLCENK